ncbi:hypothetical protein MVEN_00627000 [Mycena venus]|uniref:Uncharacterized protein n=1 Tax=Mycena venus TaxID=2733690 RepID=A0A8H7D8H6_9AGAR|nr:hypothetical protein MVEN_00627000 [Mycena venus]
MVREQREASQQHLTMDFHPPSGICIRPERKETEQDRCLCELPRPRTHLDPHPTDSGSSGPPRAPDTTVVSSEVHGSHAAGFTSLSGPSLPSLYSLVHTRNAVLLMRPTPWSYRARSIAVTPPVLPHFRVLPFPPSTLPPVRHPHSELGDSGDRR